MTPRWERDTRTLWYGQQRVKRYPSPAANQIAVIAEFDILGWPKRIDDPLPVSYREAPQRRLNETIKSLNRGQKVIRFRGDGTGQGVLWEATE